MQKIILSLFTLGSMACAASAIANQIHVPPAQAIYVTAGGGVAGFTNHDWYRNPQGGTSRQVGQPSSEEDTVGTVNAAIGYQFDRLPIRAEVAYRWFDNVTYDWDKLYPTTSWPTGGHLSVDSDAVLFNLYYDWYNKTKFIPFIGAGLGYYNNRATFNTTDGSKQLAKEYHTTEGFSWGASLGVKYAITADLFVDVRAEYLDQGNIDVYEYGSSGGRQLMSTNYFAAVSGLMNLTYKFNI